MNCANGLIHVMEQSVDGKVRSGLAALHVHIMILTFAMIPMSRRKYGCHKGQIQEYGEPIDAKMGHCDTCGTCLSQHRLSICFTMC